MITLGTIEAILDDKNRIVMIQMHTHLNGTLCVEQSLN